MAAENEELTRGAKTTAKKTASKTGSKTTAKTAAKKTTAKTTAKKTTAKTTAKKPVTKKTTAKKTTASDKLTAAEKKLVELYRKADADTKKAALAVLKGESNQLADMLKSLLKDKTIKDAFSGLFKNS